MFCNCDEAQFELTSKCDDDDNGSSIGHAFLFGKFTNIGSWHVVSNESEEVLTFVIISGLSSLLLLLGSSCICIALLAIYSNNPTASFQGEQLWSIHRRWIFLYMIWRLSIISVVASSWLLLYNSSSKHFPIIWRDSKHTAFCWRTAPARDFAIGRSNVNVDNHLLLLLLWLWLLLLFLMIDSSRRHNFSCDEIIFGSFVDKDSISTRTWWIIFSTNKSNSLVVSNDVTVVSSTFVVIFTAVAFSSDTNLWSFPNEIINSFIELDSWSHGSFLLLPLLLLLLLPLPLLLLLLLLLLILSFLLDMIPENSSRLDKTSIISSTITIWSS